MDEIIEVNNEFYILATCSRTDDHSRVLKHDDLFAVFDQYGDIQPIGLGEEGIYFQGTRFLSRLKLTLNGRQPLLLSSTVLEDNSLLTVDLTNPDLKSGEQVVLNRETIHILAVVLSVRAPPAIRALRMRNYALHEVQMSLRLSLEADFADIFEVRGTKRAERGELLEPEVEQDQLTLSYRGLDDVVRLHDPAVFAATRPTECYGRMVRRASGRERRTHLLRHHGLPSERSAPAPHISTRLSPVLSKKSATRVATTPSCGPAMPSSTPGSNVRPPTCT